MKKAVEESLFFFIIIIILLLLGCCRGQPSTQGFSCAASNESYPCQTYAYYPASSPDYLDLASIGDLFGVSRLMIAQPSNISSPASPLLSGEPLLVPLTCSCNNVHIPNTTKNDSFSYAAISYTILSDDNFWVVSTQKFANLTTYQSVEVVNPTLVPTNLSIGQQVIFPIFCKCPNRTQHKINHLISYVFQPSDNVSTVAARFGVDPQSIIDLNGNNNTNVSDTIFVPVSNLPNFTQPNVTAPVPAAAAATATTDDRKGLIIGLSIGLGIVGILLIVLMGAWIQTKRKKRFADAEEEIDRRKQYWPAAAGGNSRSKKFESEEVNLMADVSECLDKYRVFKMEELREATEGFSSKSLIQGSVYRGSIDGQFYAIKKMKWDATDELKILQKVNHGNLVKLEGFCIDQNDGTCYLIYEFVENGSLYSWLHDNKKSKTMEGLNWKTRLRIAIDVANGLQYIHEHTRPRVVHKDIKSSNILLDSSMRAKIANFGLAKSGCNAITMHIVGTQGYIAPEYLTDGIVSTRMDVFSFGVVLLELVSGKEAIDEETGEVLWGSAIRVFDDDGNKAKRVREWMDERLVGDTISMDSVVNVINLGIACVNKDASKRPTMVDIVYSLCKSDELFFDISDDGLSPRPLLAR